MSKQFRFYHSLYFKLSIVFIAVLAFVALAELYFANRGYQRLVSEINQGIDWNTAAHLANEIQPRLLSNISPNEFKAIIHPYIAMNSKFEIYLLKSDGEIYASSTAPKFGLQKKVELGPIQEALKDNLPSLPFFGHDPYLRNESSKAVFAVAPIQFNQQSGYLYIIIEGSRFTRSIRQSGQYFLTQTMTTGGALTLGFALVFGYFLFKLLTKRFRRISSIAKRYQEGDFSEPLAVDSQDEIGVLSKVIDSMAKELVAAKETIEERDLRRREFVAFIAHDLRTPLSATEGFLSEALKHPGLEEHPGLKHDINVAAENSHLLTRLVENIFELSNLEARERKPSIDAIDLVKILDQLKSRYTPIVEEAKISLSSQTVGEQAFALADEALISRVLTNLLDNALRFTPEEGKIDIKLDYKPTSVSISVIDSGKGISESDRERLLQKFQQGADSENSQHLGAGLGLAIVQKILELHDSKLHVFGEPGVGSSFVFELPLEEE